MFGGKHGGVRCGVAAAVVAMATLAHAQIVNEEIEPNDSKRTATRADSRGAGLKASPAGLPSDSITGVTTGNVVGGGINSPDYFDVVTSEDPGGLYCYYFEKSSSTPLPGVSMRGLQQSGGQIIAGSDVSVQEGSVATPINIWYGTGPAARFFLRLGGSPLTSGAYALTYRCVPYEAIPHGGGGSGSDPYARGSLTIKGYSTPSADLDLWVYDANFNPLPGYGHDEPDATGLTRNFDPGVYYVAITDGNLVNDQASPPDDANRSKPVFDQPHVIAGSSPAFPIGTMGVTIISRGVASSVSGAKVHAYQVLFFKFTVVDPNACAPCAADFNNDGGVDFGDVGAFYEAWESGNACGDVNADGGVDGSDVSDFFAVWEAGGC
jgi:hypothetical protein